MSNFICTYSFHFSTDQNLSFFSLVSRPKNREAVATEHMSAGEAVPTLAPPPKSPVQNTDSSLRFNPFDKSNELVATAIPTATDEPALPQGRCRLQQNSRSTMSTAVGRQQKRFM
jgi:hypothetical protein